VTAAGDEALSADLERGLPKAQNCGTVAAPEDRTPFDETAVTRARRRCFFCETDKSDEWKFLEKLNAFICQACRERIEKASSGEQKTG
jgi:hypothetical protein